MTNATDLSDLKLDELDRLLNDPDVPTEAARVWQLLDELSMRADLPLAEPAR